jgi:HEAT repeat protein
VRAWLRTSARAWCSAYSVVVALLAGCELKGTQPIISVQVVDRAGIGVDPQVHLDKKALEGAAVSAIEKIGGFKVRKAEPNEMPWQLTVSVQLTAERDARANDAGVVPTDQVYRAVGVTMRLESLSSQKTSGVHERYEGEALVGRNAPMFDNFEPLSKEAIEKAAGYIGLERELARANEDALIQRMGSKDPYERARAVSVAGERRLRKTVPKLIDMVRDEDEASEIVLKAIGALVAIGDPRAVGALIDSARQRPPIYLGQILFGVAQIGGKEAEAYLYTVATGHPDPEVRKNAQDALVELKKRQKAQGGGNDG